MMTRRFKDLVHLIRWDYPTEKHEQYVNKDTAKALIKVLPQVNKFYMALLQKGDSKIYVFHKHFKPKLRKQRIGTRQKNTL